MSFISLPYSFELSDNFLSESEREYFEDYLKNRGFENNIWDVFESLFKAGVKNTQPLLLRIYKDSDLCGAVILIKCLKYGRALFSNKIASGLIDLLRIPSYQWIHFGCCMDMMSNTGFVRKVEEYEEVHRAIIHFLKNQDNLSIVTDYTQNQELYAGASELPALPHALIDCSGMTSIQDYLKNYKNLKRKLKVFESKGGEYILAEGKLNDEQLNSLKKCFLSTAEKSVFYLPYQDLYLNAALTTSSSNIRNVYYFIATLNGEFIGYQAAIRTGRFLNALHGAFNRNLRTTYHAYDILFVKMTEFAIEHGIEICDFGAVLNYTKQKMVNKTIDMSYFLLHKNSTIHKFFKQFLKLTRIQNNSQLKFRTIV